MGLSALVFAGLTSERSSLIDGLRKRIPPEDENLRMNLLAILVGVVAGVGAVVFRITIWAVQELFYGKELNPGNVEFGLVGSTNLFSLLSPLGPARYVVVPAVGGLAVGLIIRRTTTAVSGHGVPKVLESILVDGGRIDPKVALYKTVASSVAIGSGGSLGREGPIVQIGSASGSYFGKFIERKSYTRTLVAAGAAGGIAATFNAPLAGVMFALEILLAEYYLRNVIAVVLSAVTATAVARPILDFSPTPGVRAFLVPVQFQMKNPVVELPMYVLLGVLIAVGGAGMVRLLYAVEHAFERWGAPTYAKPAVGGALLGVSMLLASVVLGVDVRQGAMWLFGVGYETIGQSMRSELLLWVLVVLGVMKAVGFSLSVGSGSSGGVFSPALYIGAMLGGAFGVLVHGVFPTSAVAGAYALVAMGGMFAASARAPLTATLILFELTGQYTIILPLLLVCVVGSEVAHVLLNGGTIYTQKLRDGGVTVQERRIGSLEDLTASDVMTSDPDTLPSDASIDDAVQVFQATQHHGIPVVDGDELVGILTLSDLEKELSEVIRGGDREIEVDADKTVLDVATPNPVTVRPETNLLSVVDRMEWHDVGRIPVVEDGRLVGIVTRSDVLDAYDDIPTVE